MCVRERECVCVYVFVCVCVCVSMCVLPAALIHRDVVEVDVPTPMPIPLYQRRTSPVFGNSLSKVTLNPLTLNPFVRNRETFGICTLSEWPHLNPKLGFRAALVVG